MFKKFFAISLVAVLLVGCGNKKDDGLPIDNYLDQIEKLETELNTQKETNENLSIKTEGIIAGLKETVGVLEQIVSEQEDLIDYLQEIVKDINGMEDNAKILFHGIGLGSSINEVEEKFGKDYTYKSEYNEHYDIVITLWTYANGEVSFSENKVIGIELSSDYYNTNFGVNVGDFAHQAVTVCDDFFDKVINIHDEELAPNLGWYSDDDGAIMIVHFNDKNDRFNLDINMDTARVNKIELMSDWMFD